MRELYIMRLFLEVIMFCVVLCASTAAQGVPSYGGTLVWGITNPPTIINPVLTCQGISSSLLALVFNSLVRLDGQGNIVPGLAESWDISDDGLTYVFHLHQGIRFHDGVELTAEDVKFMYEAIADPKNQSPWRETSADVLAGQWQVIDKYTIEFSMKTPNRFILYKLLREIAPRHLLAGKDMARAAFNTSPVGTGPFRFKKWDYQTQEIVLEANPDYFEGRPYLDRIVIKVYPDNTSLWAALMRQEVDLVKYLNQEDYEVLRKDSVFMTYEMSAGVCTAIVFDLQDPILADIRVREAIAQAVNVKKLINDIRIGGMPTTGVFQPDSAGFNPEVKPFVYDPQKAKSLLESAGWQDVRGDGILEKEGKRLEIKMLVDGRSGYYEVMAMIIRQQLSEIGIKLAVELYQDETEFTPAYLAAHKPQAWLRSFITFGPEPGTVLEQSYPTGTVLQRLWNYKNPKLDELIEKTKSMANKTAQGKVYQQIHQIIYEDQPACFLFSLVTRHAVARKFLNTDGFFAPSMPVYMMKDWYVARISR